MATTVKNTKATAKPTKTATKNATVATAPRTATVLRKGTDKLAKPEAVKVKAAAKPTAIAKPKAAAAPKAAPKPRLLEVTREKIQQVAYQYWAERGYPHGSALQDWLRAEQELLQKAS